MMPHKTSSPGVLLESDTPDLLHALGPRVTVLSEADFISEDKTFLRISRDEK